LPATQMVSEYARRLHGLIRSCRSMASAASSRCLVSPFSRHALRYRPERLRHPRHHAGGNRNSWPGCVRRFQAHARDRHPHSGWRAPHSGASARLGKTAALLVFGSLVGLTLALAVGQVISSIVYQAQPRDPLVMVSVWVSIALLGLFASWAPARRAMRSILWWRCVMSEKEADRR